MACLIVSKLARAAFATCASPSAVEDFAGGGLAAAAIRASPAGGPRPELAARPPKPPLLVDENALKSKKDMWAFYEYWCNYHGLKRDRSEMKRRFRTFSASARFVHKANSSASRVMYSMTKYADMTDKEMFPGLARRTNK